MFRNLNSNILFDISANFGSSFLGDKTSETPDINILALQQGVFYFFEHGFQRNQYINLWNTCFF